MALENLLKVSHNHTACLAGIQRVWFAALAVETGKLNFSRVHQYRKLMSRSPILYGNFLHNIEVNFREKSKPFRMPCT